MEVKNTAIIDTEKIETLDEAKDLIVKGILHLCDMGFDYLGLKKVEPFKMSFPDGQSYDFGINLWDLIKEIENQFPDEV